MICKFCVFDLQMKVGPVGFCIVALLAFVFSPQAVYGIRFVIDREECFSHNVQYEGDTVHASFVVIKADSSWYSSHDGVDLVVSSIFVNLFFYFFLLVFRSLLSMIKFS